MKRLVVGAGLAAAIILLFASTAPVGAAKRPSVRTVKLTIAYTVDGTYSNDDNLGAGACNVEGHERADIALRVVYRLKLRLASGVFEDVPGADFSQGSWNDSGVRWYNPGAADCSTGVGPLQCSGEVKVGSPTDLFAGTAKGAVFFSGFVGQGTQPMGEQGLDSCGDQNYVLPYFGLGPSLEPWRQGKAATTIRALASLKKGKKLTLRVKRGAAGSSWAPSTCNGGGVIGASAGETCVGSLKITKNVLVIQRS